MNAALTAERQFTRDAGGPCREVLSNISNDQGEIPRAVVVDRQKYRVSRTVQRHFTRRLVPVVLDRVRQQI